MARARRPHTYRNPKRPVPHYYSARVIDYLGKPGYEFVYESEPGDGRTKRVFLTLGQLQDFLSGFPATWAKPILQQMKQDTPPEYGGPFKPRHGNPAPAAAALFESWTGEPSTHETVVVDTVHDHSHLTDLARLVAFKLRGVRGQLKFKDPTTRLCSNETGTQLYIRGGDQAINLDDFNTVATRRVDPTKDSIVLGEIEYLYYSARKPFLGKEHTKTGVYKHKLGEETGNRPVLLYDTRSALLSISGGSYYIKPGDYDGKHSRGIVD